MKQIKITLPIDNKTLKSLEAGDFVFLTGTIFTGRDAAHKKLINELESGKKLSVDFNNQIIYYVGPTPGSPGQIIGSAGPTSSYRMDNFVEPLLKSGLKGMVGKGARTKKVVRLCKKYKAVYLITFGGCGALLSECITSSKIIAYNDLGCEAIYELKVKDFPAIVGIDCHGNTTFDPLE